jgi:hypothetical protein
MDDASQTNLRALKLKAEELIKEKSDEIKLLCDLL